MTEPVELLHRVIEELYRCKVDDEPPMIHSLDRFKYGRHLRA
jgi:hypothetical protein